MTSTTNLLLLLLVVVVVVGPVQLQILPADGAE